jgi:hypothetical protein
MLSHIGVVISLQEFKKKQNLKAIKYKTANVRFVVIKSYMIHIYKIKLLLYMDSLWSQRH